MRGIVSLVMSKVAIRLEVADDASLPQSLPHGQAKRKEESGRKKGSVDQTDDSHSAKAAIGQRQMQRLSVETYTPSNASCCDSNTPVDV